MSTIVWILAITTNLTSAYSYPVDLKMTFLTEYECEQALSTLTARGEIVKPTDGLTARPLHTKAECRPERAPKKK